MSSKITIFGSTGSIGLSTMRVLRFLNPEYEVYGLSCRSNLGLIEEQIEEFHPSVVAVESEEAVRSEAFRDLRKRHPGVEYLEGPEGLMELAVRKTDLLLSAIVGSAGLAPTLAAIPHVKRIALANKETLVMAGDVFRKETSSRGVELIPVDSEHSAIFQLMEKLNHEEVSRITLTASGGSLRNRAAEEMAGVTPEEALAHPTWSMGQKITIDSATLMNKGLEVIEAHHLFGMPYDRIGVVIHPESIVHSLVETVDGALYAHMSITDMALPILYALSHPRKRTNPFGTLNLAEIGQLTFSAYDGVKYPALDLCYAAGRAGGTMPAVLNASNEEAVYGFLGRKISLTDIVRIVETVMGRHRVTGELSLEAVFDADRWAREEARSLIPG